MTSFRLADGVTPNFREPIVAHPGSTAAVIFGSLGEALVNYWD